MSFLLSPLVWVLVLLMPFIVVASVLYPVFCVTRFMHIKRHGQTRDTHLATHTYFTAPVCVCGTALAMLLAWAVTSQEPRIEVGTYLLNALERGWLGMLVPLIVVNLLCHVVFSPAHATRLRDIAR